jgi:hypothetical protein
LIAPQSVQGVIWAEGDAFGASLQFHELAIDLPNNRVVSADYYWLTFLVDG